MSKETFKLELNEDDLNQYTGGLYDEPGIFYGGKIYTLHTISDYFVIRAIVQGMGFICSDLIHLHGMYYVKTNYPYFKDRRISDKEKITK